MSGEGAIARPTHFFVIAGEVSGDHLGAALVDRLRERLPALRLSGVGGPGLSACGVQSLFPMSDIALVGITTIIAHVPRILRRVRETVAAILADPPDALILIDCPGFTRRVGRAVRKARPDIPIIFYVSPTVWAWRPGRAKEMRPFVDHLLALLPFEPAVHARLDGPPCTYVGHPIVERLALLRPNAEEAARRASEPPVVLVLPGSRRAEIKRLAPLFRDVIARTAAEIGPVDFVLPAVPHLVETIRETVADWPVKPRIVEGEAEKFAAFRQARAALACSGTVTLELAVAGVPHVMAYRMGALEAEIARFMLKVDTAVLANLVLGEKVVPEFLQYYGTVDTVTPALIDAVREGPLRRRQSEAFARIDAIMGFSDAAPSVRAADIVIEVMQKAKGPR